MNKDMTTARRSVRGCTAARYLQRSGGRLVRSSPDIDLNCSLCKENSLIKDNGCWTSLGTRKKIAHENELKLKGYSVITLWYIRTSQGKVYDNRLKEMLLWRILKRIFLKNDKHSLFFS